MRATLAHYQPSTLDTCMRGELFVFMAGPFVGYVCAQTMIKELVCQPRTGNKSFVVVARTDTAAGNLPVGSVHALPSDTPVVPVEQIEPAPFRALAPHPDFRSHAPPARMGTTQFAGTDT
ncbi:MAG TPA: hypothetical protein PKZ76_03455 [Xanthomonadaceae bacterium]|nr:hypothetical protein [Xanthomonadaceae bacterium]